jgi:murein peptide amidase A
MRRKILSSGLLALAACAIGPPAADGKGMIWNGYGLAWIDGAAKEVTAAGSPYRYTALSPGSPGKLTVVARTDRGGGRVSRWWYLSGSWLFPAVAYDGTGGGLSADGGTLVLHRYAPAHSSDSTRFAVLDTAVHLRHPARPGQDRPRHAISRISLPGGFAFDSISPHGSTVYLRHYLPAGRYRRFDTHRGPRFEIRALDTAGGGLLPGAIVNSNAPGEQLRGLPISQAASADGRRAYTLYDGGNGKVPFVEALDTVSGDAFRIDLPGLGPRHHLYMFRLRLQAQGRRLAVLDGSSRQGGPSRQLMSIDVRRIDAHQPTATASDAAAAATATASLRDIVVGHSAHGRPIRMLQLGDPGLGANVLVFGCVHGDECAARGLRPLSNGCPDPHSNVFVVPNLNPDGFAAGTRVNGRGVDLNRNFAAGWRPIGSPGDLEYSGSRPFSEPESRLAARLVRRLRPSVTIWFHQHTGLHPLVRAWGQSAPAGRRFARLARIPFHLLPWPDGTAPNWQNHRFRGAAAFVVELPRGALRRGLGSRLERAIVEIARREARVGED